VSSYDVSDERDPLTRARDAAIVSILAEPRLASGRPPDETLILDRDGELQP